MLSKILIQPFMEKITNLSRLMLSLMLAVLAVGCSTVSKIAYLRDLPAGLQSNCNRQET